MKFPLINICLERDEFVSRISALMYLEQQISLCFINVADTLIALDDEKLTEDAITPLIKTFTFVVNVI